MSLEQVVTEGVEKTEWVMPEGDFPEVIESVGPDGEESEDTYGDIPTGETVKPIKVESQEVDIKEPTNYFYDFKNYEGIFEDKGFTTDQTFLDKNLNLFDIDYEGIYTAPEEKEVSSEQEKATNQISVWIDENPDLIPVIEELVKETSDGGVEVTVEELNAAINNPEIPQETRLKLQALSMGQNPSGTAFQNNFSGSARRTAMSSWNATTAFTGDILANINRAISFQGNNARNLTGNYPAYTGEGPVFDDAPMGANRNFSSNFWEQKGISSRAWITGNGEEVYLNQSQVGNQLGLNELETAKWFWKRQEWPTYLEVPNRDGGTTIIGAVIPGAYDENRGRIRDNLGLKVEYKEDGSFKSVLYNGREYISEDLKSGLLNFQGGSLDNVWGLKDPTFNVPLLGTDAPWYQRFIEGGAPHMGPQLVLTALSIIALKKGGGGKIPFHGPGMRTSAALRYKAGKSWAGGNFAAAFSQYSKGTALKGISEWAVPSLGIELISYNRQNGNISDAIVAQWPALESPFTKIFQSNELDSASWALFKNVGVNEFFGGATAGTGFELLGDAYNLSRRGLSSGIQFDRGLASQIGTEFNTALSENYTNLFGQVFHSDVLSFKVGLLNKIKFGFGEGKLKWPTDETGVQTKQGKSAATEMVPGGRWSNWLKENQRKPQWPQPYTEQQNIVIDPQSKLDARFSFDTADLLQFDIKDEKTLNKAITEAEAKLEVVNNKVESALKELTETMSRIKETAQPKEQQILRQMDIDEALIKPLPEEVSDVPLNEIKTAPQYFQVKESGATQAEGVSGSLQGARGFDTELAGLVTLWRDTDGTIGDPGSIYVIDGHNRLDLARRSGRKNILSRFINVPTWQEARAKAALINIAGTQSLKGSIESLDVARFLRDENFTIDDLAARGINLQSSLVAEAVRLNRLPDDLFAQVGTGELAVSKALALGSAEGVSPEAIREIYKIAKKQRWSIARIEQAIVMARNATVGVEEGVFPELSAYFKQSNIKQLLTIRTEVVKQLRARIRALAPATRLEQAGMLEEVAGTRINIEGSKEQRLATQAVLNVFNRVAGFDGPVTNILTDLASQVKGNNAASLVKKRLSDIEEAIMQEGRIDTKVPESIFNQSVVKQVTDLSKKTEKVARAEITRELPIEEINPKTVIEDEAKFNETFPTEVRAEATNQLAKKGQITSDLRKIEDTPPPTKVTKTKVSPALVEEIKKSIDPKDPWFSTEAKDQTIDVKGEEVPIPEIQKLLTERPNEIPIEDLSPAVTALATVDPKTPLDLFIRSAPDSQQASIAFNRLIDSFEKFADGREAEGRLGPIDTVGDFINLLNIGRVAIEEGTQKALRDIKTADRFGRLAAPYVQKAGKAFLQKAIADIEQVQIYTKALQLEIAGKIDAAGKKILEAGEEADRQLADIDNWENPKWLNKFFERAGLKEDAERVFPTKRPTFDDSAQPKNWAGKSAPKYAGMYIDWESDVDKAIYIVTTAKANKKNSKAHAKFWSWLTEELGIPEDEIVDAGILIRNELKENYEDGSTWRVEDTLAWQFGGTTDLMTFNWEDVRAGKFLEELDEVTLKKYLDIKDPKSKNVDELMKRAKQKYETDYIDLFPTEGYGDDTLGARFRGPLAEAAEQEALIRQARRIFPAGKIEFPFEIKETVSERTAKVHPKLKDRVGQTFRAAGAYHADPRGAAHDLIRVAQAYGGVRATFSQKFWTVTHEAVHGVLRRFMTREHAKLLLTGESHLREIAASVAPHKAIEILNGSEGFGEVLSYAAMGWHKVKNQYLTVGKPDPTWAQPLQKLEQIVNTVKSWLGKKGYTRWDELFEDIVEGEYVKDRKIAARDSLKIGDTMYYFGAANKSVQDIDFLPAFRVPDPEDFNARIEGYKAQMKAGDITLLELMMSDTRRTVSRGRDAKGNYDSKIPGKTLYLSLSEEGFILSSKVVEDQIKELISDTRAGRTGIEDVSEAQILHAAKELALGNEMSTEKVINLWEKARGGDITANDDLITSTAIGVLRDQNQLAIKELSVTFKGIADGEIGIEQKGILASKLTALWQNQLVLNQVWEQITRKWGQAGRMMQINVDTSHLTLQGNTPLKSYQVSEELVEKAMTEGLDVENGQLGDGVYFTTNDDPNGVAVIEGSLPSSIVILDLIREGKTLSGFLEEIGLDPVIKGGILSTDQKLGIQNYALEKGYDGVRFPTDLKTESVGDRVVIYDRNDANRVINSQAAQPPAMDVDAGNDALRPFIERAIRDAGQILEKKLPPDVLKSIQSGELTIEAEKVIDELAEVAYTMNTLPKKDSTFYVKDVSDLITEIPDGMGFQRTIADIRRNALFLRISTWGKVALAGTTRLLAMPIARYVGNGKMYKQAMGKGNYFEAESAKVRQAIDMRLWRQMFYQIPNAWRLSGFAWKTGETLVNPGKQHYQDARVKQFEAQDKAGNLLTQEEFEVAGRDRALVKRESPTANWFDKPTANPIALAIRYMNKFAPTRFLYQTGARKGLSAVDTFISGIGGPAFEHARLLELELHNMRVKGIMPTQKNFNLAVEKVENQMKAKWVDMIINGELIENAYLDSPYAKNGMDYVNMTDDIKVDPDQRTWRYGIKKAEEQGIVDAAEKVKFAEEFVKAKVDEENFYKGFANKEVNAAFHTARKAIPHISQKIKETEQAFPITGAVIPTNRTLINLFKATVRYVGLGEHIIDSAWRDINHEDANIRANALGEHAIGQFLLASGTLMSLSGMLEFSGPEPIEWREREKWKNIGKQANSIRLKFPWGGAGPWVNVGAFDAASPILAIIGSYITELDRIPHSERNDGNDDLTAMMAIHVAALRNAIFKAGVAPFGDATMKPIGDLFELFEDLTDVRDHRHVRGKSSAAGVWLERLLSGMMVPGMVQDMTNSIDPTLRRIEESEAWGPVATLINTMNRIGAKLPYSSRNQPAVLHQITGEPIVLDGHLGSGLSQYLWDPFKMVNGVLNPLSALKVRNQSTNIVDEEIARLTGKNSSFVIWDRRMLGLSNYILSTKQLNELITIGTKEIKNSDGLTLHEELSRIIRESPVYAGKKDMGNVVIPGDKRDLQRPNIHGPGEKVNYLMETINLYKKLAIKEFFKRNPELEEMKDEQDQFNWERNATTDNLGPQSNLEAWRALIA